MATLAHQHPEWSTKPIFKGLLIGDAQAMATMRSASMSMARPKGCLDTHVGNTQASYDEAKAKGWSVKNDWKQISAGEK